VNTPTPEQLARETLYPIEHWRRAHEALGWRDEWPQLAEWAVRHRVDPWALLALEPLLKPTLRSLGRLFGHKEEKQ
jgi:hypothetical protein